MSPEHADYAGHVPAAFNADLGLLSTGNGGRETSPRSVTAQSFGLVTRKERLGASKSRLVASSVSLNYPWLIFPGEILGVASEAAFIACASVRECPPTTKRWPDSDSSPCFSGAGMPDDREVVVTGRSRLAEFVRGGFLRVVQRGVNLIRERWEVDLARPAGSHYLFDLDLKFRGKALVENADDRWIQHRLNLSAAWQALSSLTSPY
jgi:hypothetical protein